MNVFETDRKGNYINERTNEWMMSSKQIEKVTTQMNERMNEWCLQNRSKR